MITFLSITAGRFFILINKGGVLMNTQGWIRGYMAKNMEEEKFLHHVVECLEREFEIASSISKTNDGYIVKQGDHKCSISIENLA